MDEETIARILKKLENIEQDVRVLCEQQSQPRYALSEKDTAVALGGISTKTVKRLAIRGLIKRVPKIGRVLYSTESIRNFCNSGK